MLRQFKEIFKHSLVYGVTGILSKAIGFLMIPIYTRYLTAADYGVIELLDLFVSVIGLFLNMGIEMSVFKFYYSYDKKEDKKRVISTALIIAFFVSAVFLFLSLPNLNRISLLIFQTSEYTYFIKLIILTFLLDNISNLGLLYVRARQMSGLYSIVSLLRLAAGLGFNIYFVVFLELGIVGILYSGLIIVSLTFIILSFFLAKEVGINFSSKDAKQMLKYGYPLIPSTFGMFLIHFGDRFFLQRFSGMTEVGLYAIAYKFGFIINLLIVHPFSLMWDAKMFEIEKEENAKKIYSRVFTYFMAFMIFSFTVVTCTIKDVMEVMVSEEFFSAYKIVPIIAFAYVLNGSCYLFRVGFYIKKKTHHVGVVMLITAMLTLIFYSILIPRYGAMGAAFSTLLSFVFWNVITLIAGQRIYRINYEWRQIGKLGFVSMLIILAGWLFQYENITLNIIIKLIILSLFPVMLYLFNFFGQTEIKIMKDYGQKFKKHLVDFKWIPKKL